MQNEMEAGVRWGLGFWGSLQRTRVYYTGVYIEVPLFRETVPHVEIGVQNGIAPSSLLHGNGGRVQFSG